MKYFRYLISSKIFWASVIIAGALTFVYVWQFRIPSNNGLAQVSINLAGNNHVFEGAVTDDMTVLDALVAATAAGNITFKYTQDSKNDVTIAEIDGVSATSSQLNFYLNGKIISAGDLARIVIKPSDKIGVRSSN